MPADRWSYERSLNVSCLRRASVCHHPSFSLSLVQEINDGQRRRSCDAVAGPAPAQEAKPHKTGEQHRPSRRLRYCARRQRAVEQVVVVQITAAQEALGEERAFDVATAGDGYCGVGPSSGVTHAIGRGGAKPGGSVLLNSQRGFSGG
jgi:hypothetical protein